MKSTKHIGWIIFAVVIAVIDQLVKFYIRKNFIPYQPVGILPFINIVLTYNTGAAFSFLGNADGWQRWFFVVIAAVLSICIIYWLLRSPKQDNWTACAFAFILAGALGNLYDRLLTGIVTDFIDLHIGDIHFPAYFNIADLAINIGVIMWVIGAFWKKNVRKS